MLRGLHVGGFADCRSFKSASKAQCRRGDRRDCWAVAMVTTIRRETLNGRLHDGDASSSLDGTCTADGDQFERDTAMKPAAVVELNPKQIAPVGKGDAPRE